MEKQSQLTKLVIRDYVPFEGLSEEVRKKALEMMPEPLGKFTLSWKAQCLNGEWAESPHWALLKDETEIPKAIDELRAEGKVFEVLDLRGN